MISETTTSLEPAQVLQRAKQFFSESDSIYSAALEEESESHLTFSTFRSRLAITAWTDPDHAGTRVRVSTLRPDEAVGKLLSYVRSEAAGAEPPSGDG